MILEQWLRSSKPYLGTMEEINNYTKDMELICSWFEHYTGDLWQVDVLEDGTAITW